MLIAPDVNSILIAGGSDVTPSNPSLSLIKWSKPGIIYVARNRVNGRFYVGQTTNGLSRRSKHHLRDAKHGSDLVFHEAIRKYGEDNFQWSVVQVCNDRCALNTAETWWIMGLGSLAPNGYNLTTGGEGALHTERTKKKISAIAKKWATPERMRAMSLKAAAIGWTPERKERYSKTVTGKYPKGQHPNCGKRASEETRRKQSLAHKGKPRPDLAAKRLGYKHSEETKRKIGEAHKGRKLPPEQVEKMVASRKGMNSGVNNPFYGKHHSEESLRKMAESQRGKVISDEQRKKMSDTHKRLKS